MLFKTLFENYIIVEFIIKILMSILRRLYVIADQFIQFVISAQHSSQLDSCNYSRLSAAINTEIPGSNVLFKFGVQNPL